MVTWNLNSIYAYEEHKIILKEFEAKVRDFTSYKNALTPEMSTEKFLHILHEYEAIHLQASRIGSRAELALSQNVLDEQARRHHQMVEQLMADVENKLLFFTNFFKTLTNSQAKKFIDAAGRFQFFLQRLYNNKKYMLEQNEEKIITLKDLSGSQALQSVRNIIVGKLQFPFENKLVSDSIIRSKTHNPDATTRKEAYRSLLETYSQQEEVLSQIYSSLVLDWHAEHKSLRKYETAIQPRNVSNDVGDDVVSLVLDVIAKNRTVFHDYFSFKADYLDLEPSRTHVYAPVPLPDQKTYSFEDAKQITIDVFSSFSQTAGRLAKNIFDANHVHSELVKGKRGGAFCMSYAKDEVPFVLVNHVGTIDDVSTLCHEIGHGIHGQLAQDKTQFTFHSSLALAEVASVFGELLLKDHLLQTASSQEKKYVLFKELDGFFATILRQAYFVRFELFAHEKIPAGCTTTDLHAKYYQLLQEQFGPLHVPLDFKREWLSIPHIFQSPFYCYSYAFANLVVLALFAAYKKQGRKEFIPKYLSILQAGGDARVEDILAQAGFDITSRSFWEDAFSYVEKSLQELKQLCS